MGGQAGCVLANIGPNRESSGSRPEDPAVLLGPNGLVANYDSRYRVTHTLTRL